MNGTCTSPEDEGILSGVNYNVVLGTISVMLLSSIAGALYWVATTLWEQLTRTFMVTVQVSNSDEAFHWLLDWLKTRKTVISASRMTLSSVKKKIKPFWMTDFKDEKPELSFVAGQGMHVFTYAGRIFWLNRYTEGNPMTQGWDNKPFQLEAITISTVGRDKTIFNKLFAEAMATSYDKDKGKTTVYVLNNWGDDWRVALKKPPRSFDSVILDSDYSERLLDDAQTFMKSQDWYNKCGIPYRRGYLIYGPPGTGKTSFVQALAGEMKLNIAVLSLTSKSLDDETLNMCLNNAPSNAIILLEDVDAVFVDRATAEKGPRGVSFSGLLNAIDGVASQEGRLFFMTTNHIERLDPALIRPGRCDVKIKFNFASRIQVYNMFTRFFPTEPALAEKFADSIPQNTVSMAQLQGHFLEYREGALECFNNAKKLVKEAIEGPAKVEDVPVRTWLRRLNLSQYFSVFKQWHLHFLSDVKPIDVDTLLEKLDINHCMHAARIRHMLAGDEDAKRGYTLANLADSRTTFFRFYPGEDAAFERFMRLVPPRTVSIFQLEGHFANYADHVEDALENVAELVEDRPPKHKIALETVSAWLTRMGVPPDAPLPAMDNIISVVDCEEFTKKVAEENVTDVEQVLKWEVDKFKDFGVKKEGDLWRVSKALATIKSRRVRANLRAADVTMEQVLEFDDSALKDYGVEPAGLRWRLVNDITRLKAKRDREKLQFEMLIPAETPHFENASDFPAVSP